MAFGGRRVGKTRTSVVRLTMNELAYVELFGSPFRLEAPEREERKALLDMTTGSEGTLQEAS